LARLARLFALAVCLVGAGCDEPPAESASTADSNDVSSRRASGDDVRSEDSASADGSTGSNAADGAATDAETDALARLDMEQLRRAGRLSGVPTTEVTIESDPVYDGEKRYRGWPLEELLRATTDLDLDALDDHELQFVASDGYKASIAMAEAPLDRAVVAFEDLDAPDGETWTPFRHGKAQTTPAPFYVVWRGADELAGHLPWAFKVVSIRIASYREMYGAAYPADHPEVREGFAIFKRQCIRCHSVNLRGGAVGPELNVPRNVTEYWPERHLRQFVENAASYHAGTKMPSFEHTLDDAQLDAVLEYLRAMASEKVCETAEACAEKLRE
jgi:mono/diheme cytochrome c family protein